MGGYNNILNFCLKALSMSFVSFEMIGFLLVHFEGSVWGIGLALCLNEKPWIWSVAPEKKKGKRMSNSYQSRT